MERRKAITTSAAASLTLLAGATGIALNSGIVSSSADDKVGHVSPVSTTAGPPITVFVDAPGATAPLNGAPLVEPTIPSPVTASAVRADHGDGRDGSEDEGDRYEGDRYEAESHGGYEHEGAEDDD